MFRDRRDAGRRLAERLSELKAAHPVVLALPRGGVPVAFEIAQALGAPLDLLMVRKIGAPGQAELAVAAVAVVGGHQRTFINDEIVQALGVPDGYIAAESRRRLAEIAQLRDLYGRGRPPVALAGRAAILVDDGIATGATVRAALEALGAAGAARRVLAAPVAPADTIAALREAAELIVVFAAPERFDAVGRYYDDFGQVEDAEVIDLLDRVAQSRVVRPQ